MKRFLFIIGLLLFSFPITTIASDNLVVSTSPFPVQISGNNYLENNTYPTLFYNNVVYIPMTYNVGECIGINIEWIDGYEQNILLLTEKNDNINIEKNTIIENNISFQQVKTETDDCKIAICKNEYITFIEGTEDYPLLRYKDIVYIPLTWDTIAQKFGWSYTFDESNGVCINASQSNTLEKSEKDIYISEDGSTTCYILERRKYIDSDGYDATDWIGLIRYNHEMTGKDLLCLDMGEFIIEKELSHPIKQGDVRFFKTYKENKFKAPVTRDLWTFLHAATTMMLDTRTGCINKWNTLPSWRRTVTEDAELGITSISMSGTDYVADSVDIINIENCDIELKSIPMQYVIKRIDGGRNEIILTYDVPQFPGGSLIVPAPTSAITKLHFSLPRWDFRDANGNYVPEGEYEISLIVPDTVEYVADGKTVVLTNPKGVFINSKIKLVK